MRELSLVLRIHLRILRKRFGVKRWGGVLGLLPGIVLVGGIGTALGVGAFQLFGYLRDALADQPAMREAVEVNVLALYGLGTAVMLLVNAFGSIHGGIYESDDNAFLFSTPLRVTAVLAARLVEVCLNHLVWVGPVMLGPFVAYGLARGASAGFYPLVVTAHCAYVVAIVGLAALLVTVVMRYVPGPRLKRLATILMFMCLLTFMFSLNFVMFSLKTRGGPIPLLQRLAGVRVGSLELFPHAWLARVAVLAVTGQAPWLPLGALMLLAAVLCGVLVTSAPRLYVAGWGSSQEAVRRRKGYLAWSRYKAEAFRRADSPPRSPFRALVRKELKIAFRSPVFWYMLGVGLVSVGFLLTQQVNRLAWRQLSSGNVSLMFGMLLAGSALGSLMFGGTSLSREGPMLPLWLSLPSRPRTVYLSKVAAGLPLPLGLTTIGLAAYSWFLPQGSFAPLLAPAVLVLVAMMSMVVALDALTPRYQIDQGLMPGTGSGGQSIGKLLMAYYGVFGIGLFMVAFNFPGYHQRLPWVAGLERGQAVALGWGGMVMLSAVVTYASYRLGTRALHRLLSQGGGGAIA